ncbi:hypothetical protein NDA10_000328 [Ustilago hordei]|nr:hypothetical protein NDA10_000328 [Ustilago hordei]UTT89170.1 hypothetical protein NDA17_000623 [Ustilago hordei]
MKDESASNSGGNPAQQPPSQQDDFTSLFTNLSLSRQQTTPHDPDRTPRICNPCSYEIGRDAETCQARCFCLLLIDAQESIELIFKKQHLDEDDLAEEQRFCQIRDDAITSFFDAIGRGANNVGLQLLGHLNASWSSPTPDSSSYQPSRHHFILFSSHSRLFRDDFSNRS